jgi:3-phosphoshikimate 1-carboxyvinyltransferase
MMAEVPPPWQAPSANGPVTGTVRVPGSKSITNRALVLAALASSPSRLTGALVARDTRLMITGLERLGAEVGVDGDQVRVTPGPLTGDCAIDCGLAGTVMRFLPPVAALAHGDVGFDGDRQARRRPMAGVIEGLRQLGVRVDGDALPLLVHGDGAVRGGRVEVDASGSSQFVSGLLLAAPRFIGGLELHHRGRPLPSLPHVEMTVAMLRAAGAQVAVDVTDPRRCRWRVEPGPLTMETWAIEPDLTNAAVFLAAATVTGGTVTVLDWPRQSTQAEVRIRQVFESLGAQLSTGEVGLTIRGPARPTAIEADLSEVGELVPTVAAVAALADGPSRLTGIGHLRGHETDRLAALVTELRRLGIDAEELTDGLQIRPSLDPRAVRGTLVRSYQDHRMVTFAAILGLVLPGILVEDVSATDKTLPGFAAHWQSLVTP